MKVLKTIGAAGGILLGTAALGAWVYNEARWEKMKTEFWQEQMEKSRVLKDSIQIEGQAKKAYFESAQMIRDSITNVHVSDTIRTAVKTIKY